ncbi:MAG: Hpt domain-containing protein [Thermoanaerobaculia bacterium]|jgi:HPt (histidine-containing phosphotransfer) domain-containing protein
MKRDVDFVIMEGPLSWSDRYELAEVMVELDGFMIADLQSYREGLFESMLTLFEDQTPMRIDAIRAGLGARDHDHLRHQAHELAGGASYVGAASFARHARAIETHAKERDFTGAAPLVDALEEHAGRTLAALRVVLAEHKGEPEP